MGILNDFQIKQYGTELISPFNEKQVQPSSYDVCLDNIFLIPTPTQMDLRKDEPAEHMVRIVADEFVLRPGDAVLGSTIENIKCPHDLSSRVEGKSSLGRLFLAIHVTAGVIDAGWNGQITLEIVNLGKWNIVLWKGMKIAQVSYFKMTGPCETPYGPKLGSHYLGQQGPTAASGKRGYEK